MSTTLGADRSTPLPDEPLDETHVAAPEARRGGIPAALQPVGQEKAA